VDTGMQQMVKPLSSRLCKLITPSSAELSTSAIPFDPGCSTTFLNAQTVRLPSFCWYHCADFAIAHVAEYRFLLVKEETKVLSGKNLPIERIHDGCPACQPFAKLARMVSVHMTDHKILPCWRTSKKESGINGSCY